MDVQAQTSQPETISTTTSRSKSCPLCHTAIVEGVNWTRFEKANQNYRCHSCNRAQRKEKAALYAAAALRTTGSSGLGKGSKWSSLPSQVRRQEIEKQRQLGLPQRGTTVVHVDPDLQSVRERIRALAADADSRVQTTVKDGFIYVITNYAWPKWVSVGMTTDYERRLTQYNRADPYSSFKIEEKVYVRDRRAFEARLHEVIMWESTKRRGEWFQISPERAIKCVQFVQREFNEQDNNADRRDALQASPYVGAASSASRPSDG